MKPASALSLLVVIAIAPMQARAQRSTAPDTVIVRSRNTMLHALLWTPPGRGPFPAVLINHGGYRTRERFGLDDPAVLGPPFAAHGYVCLVLYRRGAGPSVNAGPTDGDLMAQALASGGQAGRNQVQLELLEGEALTEAQAGLAYLRGLAVVDTRRVAVVGHSFGGSLSILLAARDTSIAALVLFGPAAGNWDQSPDLQQRLLAAVRQARAPTFLIHAANDFSVTPGEALAAELARVGRPHQLKIYPAFGTTARDGHYFVFRSVRTWESDVFAFLEARLAR